MADHEPIVLADDDPVVFAPDDIATRRARGFVEPTFSTLQDSILDLASRPELVPQALTAIALRSLPPVLLALFFLFGALAPLTALFLPSQCSLQSASQVFPAIFLSPLRLLTALLPRTLLLVPTPPFLLDSTLAPLIALFLLPLQSALQLLAPLFLGPLRLLTSLLPRTRLLVPTPPFLFGSALAPLIALFLFPLQSALQLLAPLFLSPLRLLPRTRLLVPTPPFLLDSALTPLAAWFLIAPLFLSPLWLLTALLPRTLLLVPAPPLRLGGALAPLAAWFLLAPLFLGPLRLFTALLPRALPVFPAALFPFLAALPLSWLFLFTPAFAKSLL